MKMKTRDQETRDQVSSIGSDRSGGLGSGSRLLLVTEDPSFIEDVHAAIGERGVHLVSCLGPAASPCLLQNGPTCPLAARATIVVVDQPLGGAFRYHWDVIPARDYAERIQLAHPSSSVVLTAKDDVPLEHGEGDVPFMNRTTVLLLLNWMTPQTQIVNKQAAIRAIGGG